MERITQNPGSNIIELDAALYTWPLPDRQESPASLWWKLALPDLSLSGEEAAGLAQRNLELEQRDQELQLLNEAMQALHAASDVEEVLLVTLEHARRLFDLASCAVWLVEEGRDELVCRAAYDPLGQIRAQQRLHIGQGIAGEVVEAGESRTRRTISGLDSRRSDSGVGTPDSHLLLMQSVACAPLRLQGKIMGVLEVTEASGTPFTPSQSALLESLATAVAVAIDRARALAVVQQQKSELEVQNKDLEAFAHTVAHDLKGSINLVTGFAYLLKEKHTTFSSQELEICVDALARGGYRLGNIIDELLLLAQVRAKAIQPSRFSMVGVVAEAQHRLSSLIYEYQAQIVCPDSWPDVVGYAPWVEEIWVNYISNAIKYGGNPPHVKLGATQMGEEVRFWVRDNGSGLTAQQQGQLFIPFTRLNQARTKGHGLGLSIVRRIMDQLGGEVGVESRPERGSIFYFTLPCAE